MGFHFFGRILWGYLRLPFEKQHSLSKVAAAFFTAVKSRKNETSGLYMKNIKSGIFAGIFMN